MVGPVFPSHPSAEFDTDQGSKLEVSCASHKLIDFLLATYAENVEKVLQKVKNNNEVILEIEVRIKKYFPKQR